MANMDYPGPCLACSAIDGCASAEQKEALAKSYCKGLEMEVNAWKARLYDVLADDGAQSNAADQLNLLKSTMKELEVIVAQLESECPADLSSQESVIGGKLETIRTNYTEALKVVSPGMFGG